jgi:hypothetical protein
MQAQFREKGLRNPAARVGCAVFTTFFYSLRSESKRFWILFASYLHVSVCFGFGTIYSHHFFASFASYSLQNIHTNSYINLRFVAKQIHFLILANICVKIFVLKRIFAKLEANFTFKQIFAHKYSDTSELSLRVASNYKGTSLTILGLSY